jgi:hypothetical protein
VSLTPVLNPPPSVVDTGDESFADVRNISYITNIGEDCIAGVADAVEHTLEMSTA